jgi:hypothetical protein
MVNGYTAKPQQLTSFIDWLLLLLRRQTVLAPPRKAAEQPAWWVAQLVAALVQAALASAQTGSAGHLVVATTLAMLSDFE